MLTERRSLVFGLICLGQMLEGVNHGVGQGLVGNGLKFLSFLAEDRFSKILFPLGKHGVELLRISFRQEIGVVQLPPNAVAELLYVPLFVRFPDRAAAAQRTQALVEPADLWAALWQYLVLPSPFGRGAGGEGNLPRSPTALSWLPIIAQEEATPRHDRLCMAGLNNERAIRTPAWFLRSAGEGELFVKPDDRWEVNNVSNRCLEIVESLQQARVQYEQTLHSGQIADLPPLEEVLISGLG